MPKVTAFAGEIAGVLLNSSEIGLIDFYVGMTNRLHVDGDGLRRVGQLIESGKIDVVIDDDRLDRIHPRTGAAYDRREHTIIVRTSWVFPDDAETRSMPHLTPGEFKGTAALRALVVHEAVHALVVMNGRAVLELADEAAAYLAHALFLHHWGSFWSTIGEANVFDYDVMTKAMDVAEAHGLTSRRGEHLTRKQYRPLREALQAHPVYSHLGDLERVEADGGPE